MLAHIISLNLLRTIRNFSIALFDYYVEIEMLFLFWKMVFAFSTTFHWYLLALFKPDITKNHPIKSNLFLDNTLNNSSNSQVSINIEHKKTIKTLVDLIS